VGIDVEGQTHVAVSQEFLNELGIDTLPQEECCTSVAEVVKAEASGQPSALQMALERAVEIPPAKRRPDLRGKHKELSVGEGYGNTADPDLLGLS
jgi:hypothetical protein